MTRNVTVQTPRTQQAQQAQQSGQSVHTQQQVQTAVQQNEPQRPQQRGGGNVCYWPAVDIVEQEDRIVVVADMPGLTAEDIHVTFEHGSLTIHGVARPQAKEPHGWLLVEYAPADWFRSFRVGDTIDHSRITARYENGVLQLELPKVETARPRRIQVK